MYILFLKNSRTLPESGSLNRPRLDPDSCGLDSDTGKKKTGTHQIDEPGTGVVFQNSCTHLLHRLLYLPAI
jgi:hypothetical protein